MCPASKERLHMFVPGPKAACTTVHFTMKVNTSPSFMVFLSS